MGNVLAICSRESSAMVTLVTPKHWIASDGAAIVTGCAVLSYMHQWHQSGHQFVLPAGAGVLARDRQFPLSLRARTHQLKIRILYTNKAYENLYV